LVIGLLAFAGTARAQSPAPAPTSIPIGDWQLYPSLEVRTRGEFRSDSPDLAGYGSGASASPVQDAYGVMERTRIGIGAEYGAVRGDPGFLRAQVTLQDARAWGTPSPDGVLGAAGSTPSSTSLYEGWIEARTSSARPAYLRIGRQAVTWGDGRLISNADWSPIARTLDAARGHASLGMFDFELLAAILETPTPLGAAFGEMNGPASSGTELYGAQVAASPAPLLKLELSLLSRVQRNAQQTSGDGEVYVSSLRVFGDANGWRYAAEGVFELQHPLNASWLNMSGAGAAYVEKTLVGVVLSPTLRLEGEYANGGLGADGKTAPFDPILPDVHQLGAMDLFAWSNTVQAAARVTVVPWAEGTIAVEYRYVRSADGGYWLDSYLNTIGITGGGEELGQEVDAWASWRPWPVLDLVGGYSAFVVSQDARYALTEQVTGGGLVGSAPLPQPPPYTASLAHFAYLQATLRVP
jgi:hypothetical protein